MKRELLLAAALSCAICDWMPAAAAGRWYVGHSGSQPCVPLDDLGDNMQRLYYGGGQMHTPADFVAHFAAMGVTLKAVSGTPPGIILYHDSSGGGPDMVLFDDPDVCKKVLETLPR